MEIKQETKSLPRNRKCGNCRYFEPAPLWRKGWCRNPRLYDRRANHLVDAATIDCEQVFRARIYWEPVPTPEMDGEDAGYSPFIGPAPADSGQEDARRGQMPPDGILRTRQPISAQPVDNGPNPNLPVITRREKATATPGVVPKPSRVRRWLVENIPYYDKVDGPIGRVNWLKVLPWGVLILILLVVLLNVLGGKKDSTTTNNQPAGGTPSATIAPSVAGVTNSKNNFTPTPTLSNIVPTATAVPAPTATVKAAEVMAKVIGVGPDGLKMRKDPGTTAQVLKLIPEGRQVKIRSGEFRSVGGITWWPIAYEGVDGWASSQYLEQIKPNP